MYTDHEYEQYMYQWLANYGKYPKILYTKVSDEMAYANSAEPDQTAPVYHSNKYRIIKNNCIKSKI